MENQTNTATMSSDHSEENQLTPEEEVQAEMAVSAALFDLDNDSSTFIGEGMTPEMLKLFQAQIQALNASEVKEENLWPTIYEVVGSPQLKDPKSFKSKEEAERELGAILELLKNHKLEIIVDSVDDIDPDFLDFEDEEDRLSMEEFIEDISNSEAAEAYESIVNHVMPFRLHPEDAKHGFSTYLDQFYPDNELEEMADYCAQFIHSLLNKEADLRDDLLDEDVRVNGEYVGQEIAVLHLNNWKDQFKSIKLLGFQSGKYDMHSEDSDIVEFFFVVAYETTTQDGTVEIHQGKSKAEIQEEIFELTWVIRSLELPGFSL